MNPDFSKPLKFTNYSNYYFEAGRVPKKRKMDHPAPVESSAPVETDSRVPVITDEIILEACLNLQRDLHPKSFIPTYCSVCDRSSLCGLTMSECLLNDPSLELLYRTPYVNRGLAEDHQPTPNVPYQMTPSGNAIHVHRILLDKEKPYLLVCNECSSDLSNETIPLFSIPNFMFAEPVPQELSDLSLAESVLLARVYPRSIIVQCSDGGGKRTSHSYVKGHIISFENDVGNLTSIIPRPATELASLLKVVVAGPSNMNIKLAKINRVRKSVMETAAKWLIKHNFGYGKVTLERAWLREDHDRDEYIQDPDRGPIEEFKRRIPSHATFEKCDEEASWQPPSTSYTIGDFTTSCVFSHPSQKDTDISIKIKAAMNTWNNQMKDGISVMAHGNEMMDIYGKCDWIPLMYCQLFPLGICGPASPRPRTVTLEQWAKYFLTCQDVRFREHPDFIYVLFNIIQRKKVSELTRYITMNNP